MTSATATTPATAEFAAAFAEGWAIGATDPERFIAHFAPRMTPDARFVQPLSPTFRGPEGLRQLLGPLFAAFPDLRGEVLRWGATEDGLLIELRLHASAVQWTTLDRITLRDGLMTEREAHFDPLPLIGALLRRPRAAARLLPTIVKGIGRR